MKLIDKDALLAEIERLDALYHTSKSLGGDLFIQGLFCFLDTLEVKEVDLDNEIIDYINKHYHIRFDETLERGNDSLTTIDFEEIAKHFFELGIKEAQKGE